LHGKDEDYKLFWPEKTDFVRIAAKFNATIVPLSAIGAADSVNIVADATELVNLPFGIGENLSNFSKSTVSARFDAKDEDEIFIPPLALPKPFPARHYFLFGRSFDTTQLDPNNKDDCQRMYLKVKEEVQQGIDALLLARKDDPYALDGVKRDLYQRLYGKAPPTFPLSSLSKSNNSL
jgi:1-acyl-sn-glycerol-3-phosphate acyltransferase